MQQPKTTEAPASPEAFQTKTIKLSFMNVASVAPIVNENPATVAAALASRKDDKV